MKAIWNDVVIAESDDTVIIEGNHYFPYDSVKKEFFSESDMTSFCGWKGMANYYSVTVNDKTNKDCACIMLNQMMRLKKSKAESPFGMASK